MAQNFVLKAILDTSDVAAKLKNIAAVSGKYKTPVNLLGKTGIREQASNVKVLTSTLRDFNAQVNTNKNTGLFGDSKGLTKTAAAFNKMFGAEAHSNLTKTRMQLNQLTLTYAKLQALALKGNTRGFKKVFNEEGVTGLTSRAALGRKAFSSQNALQSIASLRDITNSSNELESLQHKLSAVGIASTETAAKIHGGFSPLVNLLNRVGVSGNSLGQIFGTLAGKVTTWLIATSGIFMVIRLVGSLVKTMKSLEDATIRLQRVMPSFGDQLEADTKSAHEFAKAMNDLAAVSYGDTLDSLQNAVRAGFNLSDAMDLSRASILASNVTELEAAEATKYFVATIRQFNLEASDSLWILNQWNELGKRTGATTKDIAEAVVRSGKAFKAAGGTLAQLNAIAAATVEATGESGEKIGTMLKTVSARYSDLSRANSVNTILSKHGIRVQKQNLTSQNDIFEVLQKLSGQWDTLTKAEQANIAKAFSGIRQYSRFLGIVSDFDSVIQALVVSIDSNNSALSENERRAKSLDFALGQLKGSFQDIALNSKGLMDVMKSVVGTASLLNNTFNAIAVNPIGDFFIRAASAITTAALAFKILQGTMMGVAAMGGAGLMAAVSGPIGWLSAAIALAGTYWLSIRKASQAQEDFFKGEPSRINSLIGSKKSLADNSDTLINKFLDPRTSKDLKDSIESAFKNVANITLADYLIGDADIGMAKIKVEIKRLTGRAGIFGELKKSMITNEKYVNLIPLIDDVGGLRPGGTKVPLQNKIKYYQQLRDIITRTLPHIKKLSDLDKIPLKDKAWKLINEWKWNEGSTNLDSLEAKMKEFGEGKQFEEFLKTKEDLEKLGVDDLAQFDALRSIFPDIMPKNVEKVAAAMERIRYSADEIQASTRKMYDNISDALFELKDGNSILDNLTNAFQAFGDVVYNEMKTSIVDGMVEGMKEAVFLDDFKMMIKDGTKGLFSGLIDMVPEEFLKTGGIGESRIGLERLFTSTGPNGEKGESRYEAGRLLTSTGPDIDTGNMFTNLLAGAAAGGFTANATGKDSGGGAIFGGIGSIIGAMIPGAGLAGSLLGGLVGGLFAPSADKDAAEEAEAEKINYAKQSNKELQYINRNTTAMVEELKNFSILQESYYFSFSNSANRGLVGG